MVDDGVAIRDGLNRGWIRTKCLEHLQCDFPTGNAKSAA
jgi:hypothetical protein